MIGATGAYWIANTVLGIRAINANAYRYWWRKCFMWFICCITKAGRLIKLTKINKYKKLLSFIIRILQTEIYIFFFSQYT